MSLAAIVATENGMGGGGGGGLEFSKIDILSRRAFAQNVEILFITYVVKYERYAKIVFMLSKDFELEISFFFLLLPFYDH